MKLERIHEYVTSVVVIGGGILVALYCARLTGGGQMKMVGLLALVSLCTALMIGMRAWVWLLLPIFWGMAGRIPVLALPFAVRDIVVLLVFGSFFVFYALKIVRAKPKFDTLSLLIVALLLYLATVWIRNPVGASFLGSEMVGGRPYFNIVIAFLAYFVLNRAPISPQIVRLLPVLTLIGTALLALGAFVSLRFPSIASLLGQLYSDFAPEALEISITSPDAVIQRDSSLRFVSQTSLQLLCAYFAPITLITPMYPWRFLGAAVSAVAMLASGFRSSIITVFSYVVLSTWFRERKRDFIVLGVVGVAIYAIIAVGNGRVFNLPLPVQRSLSFLPGTWDIRASADAKGSVEWRTEMWVRVLTEDKWIRNKWLGDGFGFTKTELSIMISSMQGGTGFIGGAQQEGAMIVGSYHNGPLSTIRYAGLVGLLLYYPLLIILAQRSARLVWASRGTPLFAPTLFIAMVPVFEPVSFAIGANGFDTSLIQTIFTAGLIKVVERGLPQKAEDVESMTITPPRRVVQRPAHRQRPLQYPHPSV